MSEFTFNNDRGEVTEGRLQGQRDAAKTVTHDTVSDIPAEQGTEEKFGSAELSFKNCPIKRLLGHMRVALDAEICGDVDITSSDADVFVKGVAGKRLVKELGLVYGTLSGGLFTEAVPDDKDIDDLNADGSDADLTEDMHAGEGHDSDASVLNVEQPDSSIDISDADKGWFLRVLRADGEEQYIEIKAINDIVNGMQAQNSVTSVLGLMQEMGALQRAVHTVASESFAMTEADADRLEARLDSDILTLEAHLQSLQSRLKAFIDQSDSDAWAHIDGQLSAFTANLESMTASFGLHGVADMVISDNCPATTVTFTSDEAIPFGMQDVGKWMIQVSIVQDSQTVLRHDLDILADSTFNSEGKLEVTTSAIACEPNSEPKQVKLTAIWCGPVLDLGDTTELYCPDFSAEPLTENSEKDSDLGGTVYSDGSSSGGTEMPGDSTGGGYTTATYTAQTDAVVPLAASMEYDPEAGLGLLLDFTSEVPTVSSTLADAITTAGLGGDEITVDYAETEITATGVKIKLDDPSLAGVLVGAMNDGAIVIADMTNEFGNGLAAGVESISELSEDVYFTHEVVFPMGEWNPPAWQIGYQLSNDLSFRDQTAIDVARDLMRPYDTYGIAQGDDQMYSRLFVQHGAASVPATIGVDYLGVTDIPRDEMGHPRGVFVSFFSSDNPATFVHSDDQGNHYIRLDEYSAMGWHSLMQDLEDDPADPAEIALQVTLYTGVEVDANAGEGYPGESLSVS